MILRDDDIYLSKSPRYDNELYDFEKFKETHKIIRSAHKVHTLAINASCIDDHPELTEYILRHEREFAFGTHGWDHSDFCKMTAQEIKEDCYKSITKIQKTFGERVRLFFAPWNRFDTKVNNIIRNHNLKLNTDYIIPGEELRDADALCFHYWNDEEREMLKQIIKKI